MSSNWFPLLLVPFAELVRMKTNPLMLVESMVPLRSTKWLAISTSLQESKNSQDNYVINYTFIIGSKVKAKKFPIILLCTCRIPKRVTKNFIKNHFSHLSPCGHPIIMDTPIKQTVAKPLAKTNYKRLSEINSHYYRLLLKRTWIQSSYGVRYKGSWLY